MITPTRESLVEKPAGKKRILIPGGGFAGASTARHLEKELARAPQVEIVVIARENFVLFTPTLHEVAGSDVAVTHIVQPLCKMLRRTRAGIAEVEAIDLVKQQVRIRHDAFPNPFEIPYAARAGTRRGDEFVSHAGVLKSKR